MEPVKKSSIEWLKTYDGVVLDPDGWDRSSQEAFDRSMAELITEDEFERRLARSTTASKMPEDIIKEAEYIRALEMEELSGSEYKPARFPVKDEEDVPY
jgi:hypothetical protein